MRILYGTILASAVVGAYAALADGCGLVFDWREDALTLRDAARNENLFEIPGGRLFLPDFAKDAAAVSRHKGADGSQVLEWRGGALAGGRVTVVPHRRGFFVRGSFTPSRDVVMNRLDILPAGTRTLFYEINNYRNFHATDQVWTRIVLGSPDFATDTYSKDWQFAPHPSAMLFTRNDAHLIVGATCAPVGGYGLYAKGGNWKLDGFYLHYGDGEWGWKIRAGETWESPEFYFAFDRGWDVHASWARFGADLAADGRIADPAAHRAVPWHSDNVYCTWLDQALLSGYIPDADLKKQSLANPSIRHKSWLALDERLVREAAAIIRRERLPLRTIIIDGGWMRNTMDFRADPVRFPDFRGLVDDLHAQGFKVMVWWTWSECRDEGCEKAIGRHNTMLNGKRNCHRRWMADFSKKSAQEEWLKPTMRRLFSSEPGCYDLDGVKTDYQADKIHFDLPAEDPQWRGEENYFRRLYALFTSEMRKWKPDAQHCGCAGNWHLAEFIDRNRTYDVASDSYLEHENRARMLLASAAGAPPVYDMHGYRAGYADWVASARRLGVPVHVGNLFRIKDDRFSESTPMTDADFDAIRVLKDCGPARPKDRGAWYYKPYEYEAWKLRQMRNEADRGILHFSYHGRFLELSDAPKAIWSEKRLDGLEPVPGEPDAPPHRTEPRTTAAPLRFADGVYDLGREDIGYVYAEAKDRPVLFVGESRPEVANADTNGFEQSTRMVPGGEGLWRSEIPLALRYFRFETPVESAKFLSQVDWRDPVGRFSCSDARKERIWKIGVETIRLCTRTFLVDGIKRDRLPWAADLAVEILAEAYSFGDPEPIKRTLSALGSGEPDKVGNLNGIASFSMWWVIAHDLLQRYFCEQEYLELHYPRIRERLSEMSRHEDERGFFVRDLGWDFMDWMGRDGENLKSEISRQVIYFGALNAAARLAGRVHDDESAKMWKSKADRLKAAILAAGMDNTRHSRLLAIALGLVDGESARRYAREIATGGMPPTVTPYMATFEVLALMKGGEKAAALAKFESVWGAMADAGVDAYWESWDSSEREDERYAFYNRPFGRSLCHAWSSGPVFLIPGVFLGIEPGEDGWRKITRRPHCAEFAPDAEVVVPTPYGPRTFKADSAP